MRFVGHGHPAIRATHTKTLELSPGAELSERGTCIVAVGAEADPVRPMAGPVRIRIRVAGHEAELTARANSSWTPGGPIVIRRSAFRLPGTFATDSSAGAADLPHELVAALRDPDACVTVEVDAVPDPEPTVVLFAADASRPDDPRLLAEWDAADSVERQDAGARALVAAKHGDGTRHLVVATSNLPGTDESWTGTRSGTGGTVEVVGLPTQLAVAAAGGGDVTGTSLAIVGNERLRESLRRLPAATRIATETVPIELSAVLALALETRGSSRCVVAQPSGPMQRADVEHLPTLYGRDPVFVCFDAAPAGALDPDVRAAIAELIAAGVSTKTAAATLATLTNRSRRAAYDAVLAMAAGRGEG